MGDSSFSVPISTVFLFNATRSGNLGLLKSLVAEYGYGGTKRGKQSLMQVKDPVGRTLLHYAIYGETHVCKYLIQEHKFDVDVKDNMGSTPLLYAIEEKQNLSFVYLLNLGAEHNTANHEGLTPLHYAAKTGQLDHLQLLISKGAEVDALSLKGTPLHCAVASGMETAVKILLDNHADPNSVSQQLSTPLVLAITVDSIACARLLLKGGADPNLRCHGESPLLNAVSEGQTEMINCLLKGGADPNVTNFCDFTPIEIAAIHGSRADVMALFQATTAIPRIPVWSVDGILEYVHSVEAVTQRESKVEEKFLEAKTKGAERFARNAYFQAIHWYTEAARIKPNDATMHSNLSLCWARLNNGELALVEALTCMKLNPEWPKTYYRVGTAWKIMQMYNKAAEAFHCGLLMNPGNNELQDAKREAQAAAARMTNSMSRILAKFDAHCSMISRLDP